MKLRQQNIAANNVLIAQVKQGHRRSQGGKGAMAHPKFLDNMVILCFERHFSKQNSVIRLQSNILAPQNFRH